mgnify:CR=1 FL=1
MAGQAGQQVGDGQQQGAAQAQQGATQQGANQQGGGAQRQARYTDADVDAIISKKFAKWREQHEAKVAEAAKLAEMNATQRAEYERDQLQRRLDELERERSVSGMVAESRRQLSDRGISVPDELVGALVGETAEDTKRTVDAFADAFEGAVDAAVRARLSGTAPRSGGAAKSPTRVDILKIEDTEARQRAIREHPELFFTSRQ